MIDQPIDPHDTPLKTLEATTPFRYFGHRYVVEIEADSTGLVKCRDQMGGQVVFTAEALVEKSS